MNTQDNYIQITVVLVDGREEVYAWPQAEAMDARRWASRKAYDANVWETKYFDPTAKDSFRFIGIRQQESRKIFITQASKQTERYNWERRLEKSLEMPVALSCFFLLLLEWSLSDNRLLKGRQRRFRVFVLARLQGKKFEDLAAELGVGPATANALSRKFESQIFSFLALSQKAKDWKQEHITPQDFLKKLALFYECFVK